MQGGPDALVGLGAGDEEAADAKPGQHRFEVGLLEGVGVALVHQRLRPLADQLRHVLPLVAVYRQVLARMLYPDDGHVLRPGLGGQGADVRHDGLAVVRAAHDSVLDVDDQQRGVRSCGQGRHACSRLEWLTASAHRTTAH